MNKYNRCKIIIFLLTNLLLQTTSGQTLDRALSHVYGSLNRFHSTLNDEDSYAAAPNNTGIPGDNYPTAQGSTLLSGLGSFAITADTHPTETAGTFAPNIIYFISKGFGIG
ncbi:MAG: hypothetical protein ACHQQQ_04735 [Bacteroidota bacterium]